jgi:hypothetical protein
LKPRLNRLSSKNTRSIQLMETVHGNVVLHHWTRQHLMKWLMYDFYEAMWLYNACWYNQFLTLPCDTGLSQCWLNIPVICLNVENLCLRTNRPKYQSSQTVDFQGWPLPGNLAQLPVSLTHCLTLCTVWTEQFNLMAMC